MNVHSVYIAAANYLLFWIPRSCLSFGLRLATRKVPNHGCTARQASFCSVVRHESYPYIIDTNLSSRRHVSVFPGGRIPSTQIKMMTTIAPETHIDCEDDNNHTQTGSSVSPRRRKNEQRLERVLNSVGLPDESKISSCLQAFLQHRSDPEDPDPRQVTERQSSLAMSVMDVVEEFSAVEASTEKLAGRRALEEVSRQLISGQAPTDSKDSSALIATILVSVALALNDHSGGKDLSSSSRAGHRSIASAVGGTLAKQGKEHNTANDDEVAIVHTLFKALFQEATSGDFDSTSTDWHIISGLAKSLQVDCLNDEAMAKAAAKIISELLQLDDAKSDDSSMNPAEQVSKIDAAAALALAAQLQPWQVIEPSELINLAISLDLDHAAERICDAVTSSYPETAASRASVEALLDGAFESKQYRQADNYATKFFHVGGKRRFLEARYLHACSTIAKVIRKGALPVIDKQIDRVDKAIKTMEKDSALDSDDTVSTAITCETAGGDIRSFTLEQLEETENADAAHRLASLWGVEYAYDEETVLRAAQARRKKYLQWEDLVPGSPPDLISTPEALIKAMSHLENNQKDSVYGFDTEWSENDAGVDVLQVASLKSVALIDIPALSSSIEGCAALELTVGRMFASCTMVGFACRQDISKLRGSPTCYRKEKDKKHWLQGSNGVVDLQTIVSKSEQSLNKVGLSRVCERFLGKPLDKSEQCSLWNARPLSLRQRTYAALDAWTVRAIYDKFIVNPT